MMNQQFELLFIGDEEAARLPDPIDRDETLLSQARDLIRMIEPAWIWEEEALCERTQLFDRVGKIFLDLLTCERGERADELTPLLELYWRHLQLLQQALGLQRETAHTSYTMCLRLIPLVYSQLLDYYSLRLEADDFRIDFNAFYHT